MRHVATLDASFVRQFKKMHAPAALSSPQVVRFCAELAPGREPVRVPVRPERLYGNRTQPLGRCYEGVSEFCGRFGGTFRHGWMLWECEGLYLRAYHHCVHWDGQEALDVSNQGPYRTITFLPTSEPGVADEYFEWFMGRETRHGVPSRYFPLSDTPQALEIVKLHKAKVLFEPGSSEWFEHVDRVGDLELSAQRLGTWRRGEEVWEMAS